jgi:hypothetical protein
MVKESKPAATSEAANAKSTGDAAAPPKAPPTPAESLSTMASLLEGAVKALETRLIAGRLMRQVAAVRKHLSASLLRVFVAGALADDCLLKPKLLAVLDEVGRWLAGNVVLVVDQHHGWA